ncbi:deoxyribonuclease IV [Nonomuraea sp. 3-1Str]|uniref:deoxyribonuclease IV n=1 Tax=Nonomuraea sp. 3-1Str TaxID=2929801 RepID=UPI00286688E1|nr:deoxyribonuclease IV [Nonomuraea sp. 3-1Str]MDR8413434.1 deoxyribonuclease IV [Nonomuraea sp. 3-1Str]
MTSRSLIGAHVFVSGGLAKGGLAYMAEIGAEMIQVFVTNPRGWALTEGRSDEDAKLAESGVETFVHVPYLVNFGSPSPETLANSVAVLRHTLRRGAEIGAKGVVVHTGSAVTQPRDDAMRQLHEHLLPLLEEIPDGGPDVLLEPMAGQGAMLCATVEDVEPYLAALDWHPRAGVCLDTCHAFAAGHDLTSEEGLRETFDTLHKVAEGRLGLIHANDSKDACGSKKDRHENIGAGLIGSAPFGALMRHPAVAGVPICIETPGKADQHRADLDLLKSLRDQI